MSHAQEKQRNQEFEDCSSVACTGVTLKWAAIDVGKDASYATGFAAGIPTALGVGDWTGLLIKQIIHEKCVSMF